MKNKITLYNANVLRELKDCYPQRWEKLSYTNKEKWITKEDYPTYKQLVQISKVFNVPFGYLFLEKLPKKELPIRHFRTLGNDESFSDELYDTIMMVKKQQSWVKEILLDWGHQKLDFAGKYTIKMDPQRISKEIKKILKLDNNWASIEKTKNAALKQLIHKYENAGIFVIINGIVGNNTHRKLNVDEFRGFVLFDEIAPFVFINNNDFLSAKIFTLIHELVHIMIGKSASFDLRQLRSADDPSEKFCDQCAAEFLVPEEDIIHIKKIDYEKLSQQFKVSKIVIARRLLDTGKITKDEFFDFYNRYIKREIKPFTYKHGNFYNTVQQRYGRKFLEIIMYALSNSEILHRDVYRLLSLKPKTAEKIIRDFSVW